MKNFQFHLGFNKLYTVEPCGTSGGLTLFYNNEVNVNVFFANNRVIDIQSVIQKKMVFMSFVYSDPVPKYREKVWEWLTRTGLLRLEP